MNKSTDGWSTVRRGGGAAAAFGSSGGNRRWGDRDDSTTDSAREMPSAFGGGSRMSSRRDEEAQRAWEQRRATVEKERVAKAEEMRQAKLRDITDTEQYPTLGGVPVLKPKVKAINFRDMARETAARSAIEEAEAVAEAKRREIEASRRIYGGAGVSISTPRLYRHGSYDDGPVDHDFPDEEGYYPHDEEDEYAGAPPQHYMNEDHEEQANTETEFNSHLAVVRRRGDKSDW